MPPKKDDRPTFSFNNNEDMPVKAGGVLFYRFNKDAMDLLLVDNEGTLEDLGGCTDAKDTDIYKTVSREVDEESNGKFKRNNIEKRIRVAEEYVYIPRSKYIIFLEEVTDKEAKLKMTDFGNREIHDDIPRKVKWVPLTIFLTQEVIQHKLNWRLKHKHLFDKLKQIKSDKSTSKNMFSEETRDASDSEDEKTVKTKKKSTKKKDDSSSDSEDEKTVKTKKKSTKKKDDSSSESEDEKTVKTKKKSTKKTSKSKLIKDT